MAVCSCHTEYQHHRLNMTSLSAAPMIIFCLDWKQTHGKTTIKSILRSIKHDYPAKIKIPQHAPLFLPGFQMLIARLALRGILKHAAINRTTSVMNGPQYILPQGKQRHSSAPKKVFRIRSAIFLLCVKMHRCSRSNGKRRR